MYYQRSRQRPPSAWSGTVLLLLPLLATPRRNRAPREDLRIFIPAACQTQLQVPPFFTLTDNHGEHRENSTLNTDLLHEEKLYIHTEYAFPAYIARRLRTLPSVSRVADADVCLGGCDPHLCAVGKQCIFLEEPGKGGATTVLLPDRKIPCPDLMMMMMNKQQGATLKRETRKMVIPYMHGLHLPLDRDDYSSGSRAADEEVEIRPTLLVFLGGSWRGTDRRAPMLKGLEHEAKRREKWTSDAQAKNYKSKVFTKVEFKSHKDEASAHWGESNFYAQMYRLYRGATFSLQMGGDTPTRRGFFDSVAQGCIPVVTAGMLEELLDLFHGSEVSAITNSVVVLHERKGTGTAAAALLDRLMAMPRAEVAMRRRVMAAVLPRWQWTLDGPLTPMPAGGAAGSPSSKSPSIPADALKLALESFSPPHAPTEHCSSVGAGAGGRQDARTSNRTTIVRGLVVGMGFGHTGTTSLAKLLRRAGLTVHHWSPATRALYQSHLVRPADCNAMYSLTEGADVVIDEPLNLLWHDIARCYPKARFILTTRGNSTRWAESEHKWYPHNATHSSPDYNPMHWGCCSQALGLDCARRFFFDSFGDGDAAHLEFRFDNHFEIALAALGRGHGAQGGDFSGSDRVLPLFLEAPEAVKLAAINTFLGLRVTSYPHECNGKCVHEKQRTVHAATEWRPNAKKVAVVQEFLANAKQEHGTAQSYLDMLWTKKGPENIIEKVQKCNPVTGKHCH